MREDGGNASLTVTVDRSNDPDPGNTITVQYQTKSGSATPGSDYVEAAGTLTFGPGDTSETIVVPIADDSAIENTEGFSAFIFNPNPKCERSSGDPPCYYQTPTFRNSTAEVLIFDNDRANTIQFDPSSYTASEAAPGGENGQVTLTVTAERFGDPTYGSER